MDFWKESLGEKYSLYHLIDPRNGKVCYIGITKQKFSLRLNQHRNPKSSNMAAIAKLQRNLKKNGLTLQGYVYITGSKKLIEAFEKYFITGFWTYLGKNSIKNHQVGGLNTFGMDTDSKIKSHNTITKKRQEGTFIPRNGEKIGTSKLKEEQILNIYSLIKNFKTNEEIIKELNLDIGTTNLNSIRKGKNWKHIWEREKMIDIPSLKKQFSNSKTSLEKFKVLEDIEKGLPSQELKVTHQLQYTDIERIRAKTLWKPIWEVYEKIYKPLKQL